MAKASKDVQVDTRPRVLRSLASKFSLLTMALVLWVLATLLVYDLFRDAFTLREGLLMCGIVVLVSATVSRFTMLLVARPLKKLADGIHAVRSGRLEPIPVSQTGDEIEYLGESFNGMIQALAATQKESREQQEHLEERIQEQIVRLAEVTRRAEAADQTRSESTVTSESAAPAKSAPPDAMPAQARILVVEDNAVNQKVVTAVLRKRGYTIELAQDGREALAKLESPGNFALVLMDVQMPVLDGLEATRQMRKDPRWKALPVVAMTAHAMNGDRQRCLDAGMNGYISKPVHPTHLLATVDEYLSGRVAIR